MPDSPSSNELDGFRDQIRALRDALDSEIADRKTLESRLKQQDSRIRELERRTQSILQSRIWKTLVWCGARVLQVQERAAFWSLRWRLLRKNLKQIVLRRTERAVIHLDFPAKNSSVGGRIKIRGWAAAVSGIDHVEIRVGNRLILSAKTGLERPDVARTYRDFSEAGRSGFAALADLSALPVGPCPVFIYATTRRGILVGHRITINIKSASNIERRHTETQSAALLQEMNRKPVISILMPVFETPERWLRSAIDSVRAQFYPNWELCIADDCSSAPHVRRVLEEYASRDRRVKLIYRERNGHISAASNSALELASGEFVALLDHDDEITPDALLEVALAHNLDPDADMLYSDEDKIDEDGFCSDPFFKPDWSPEYLLTCMYTCHLGAYRTKLVRELGGFRDQATGAQDYDLVLRLVSASRNVVHIPRVLYHWRAHRDSTALSGENKDYAYPAARWALQEHLNRSPFEGEVLSGPRYGFHRVRFFIRDAPLVSVIIPSAGRLAKFEDQEIDLLRECVASIVEKSTWRKIEIVVVDNGDLRPELRAWLEPRARLVTYRESQFNLARKINLGASRASGEHLLLLNDDTRVISPDWVEGLLQYSQQPAIGAVGPKLLFPGGRIQHAGVLLLNGNPGHPYYDLPEDEPGYFLSAQVARNYLAVTGACLMTRRAVFEEVGGFSEEFSLNYNDVDFCLKLHQRGYRIVYVPNTTLYHYESLSKEGPGEVARKEIDLFRKKWGELYSLDPYYNPNLSPDHPYEVAG